MLNFIKKLFSRNTTDFKSLIERGAQIIDVRTLAEYNGGHLHNAKNVPLQDLQNQLPHLNKNNPIITCCASGARSESAKSILKNNGFEAYNGGSWKNLREQLQ